MMHQHLNEEDVQLLALHADAASDTSWQTCAVCRERVETCRLMFSSLGELEPETAGFDLESAVLARLPVRMSQHPAAPRPMSAAPIWIGSLAFLAVLGLLGAALKGYFVGTASWITGLVVVTAFGIAIWLLIDAIQDHRQKLRSLGLS